MRKSAFINAMASCLFLGTSSNCLAIQFNPVIEINGFASAGASMTNATNVDFYNPIFKIKISEVPTIDNIGQNPTFLEDTSGGIQFAAAINDSVSLTAQFFSEGSEDFAVVTDWLFVEWQISDEWDIKIGRLRLPFYLYSQYYNVGYTYIWSRPPIEVYNFASLTDFDGLTLRYINSLGYGWHTEDSISFGNTILQLSQGLLSDIPFAIKNGVVANITLANNIVKFSGGYATGSLTAAFPAEITQLQQMLENPCAVYGTELSPELITLTAGPAAATCIINTVSGYPLTIPASLSLVRPDPATAQILTVKNANTNLLTFGYELEWHNIINIAEWTKISSDDRFIVNSQAWYVTLGYNWDNITPHVTYSTYRTTDDDKRVLINSVASSFANPFSYFGPLPIPTPETLKDSLNQLFALSDAAQSTIDVGIRYDVIPSIALKFDYRYVIPQRGTKGFFDIPPGKRISWVTAVANVVF